MTPNFALSLSFDGIALLWRVPDGWHLVGKVPLDTPDLTKALSDLRSKGLALDPTGMWTKLVIPPEQIRYMTLDSDQTTEAEVRAALDGATPYALDELVIDTVRADGRTHIAAVARETLAEAEAFAVEHHFNPVSCVAAPAAGTVAQEVLFGPTRNTADITPSRDIRPVVQTGIAQVPASHPVTAPAADTPKGPASGDADTAPHPTTSADPVPASRTTMAAPTATLWRGVSPKTQTPMKLT